MPMAMSLYLYLYNTGKSSEWSIASRSMSYDFKSTEAGPRTKNVISVSHHLNHSDLIGLR